MTLQFAWPWLLLVLPLPLLSLRLLPAAKVDTAAALRVPFLSLLRGSALLQNRSRPSRWRRVLAALAWGALVVAAARPQGLGEAVQIPVTGRSLMLAVDISGSMVNADMQIQGRQVPRLAAVQALAGDFLRRRAGDRVGLILFGREAYLQAPLTLDRQTVAAFLDEAQVGLAGRETAIGDAIGLAVKRLRDQPEQNRVLLLLTDGANTAGAVDPLKAADLAAQEGVRIYTIGVGGDRMRISTPFGTRTLPATDLDERVLRQIAEKTAGGYFRARDTAALARIYAELDAIEPASEDALSYRPVHELYAWPLGIALALSVLTALPMRPTGQKPSRTRERSHV